MVTVTPSGFYYLGLIKLTLDQGTIVVRKILDERISNVPLHLILAKERKEVEHHLKAKNIITKDQYYVLFPGSCNPPTTADIDFYLALILLRNLNACGLNPNFNWKDQPQPGDKSLEAGLRSLQMFRNELAHVPSPTAIDDTEFHQIWSEIEQVLLRLNGSLQNPIPNLQQCINDLKNWTLFQEQNRNNEKDETDEEKVLRLEQELDEIRKRIEEKKNLDDHGNTNKPGREEDISSDICLDEGEESSKNSSTPTTDQTCKEKATEWKQVDDHGNKNKPGRKEDISSGVYLDEGEESSKNSSTPSTDQTCKEKAKEWKQDAEAWLQCIEMNDKEEAQRLICERILPDHEMLNKASTAFESDPQIIKIICDEINLYIKAESNKIINVYAGYENVGDKVVQELVFAVITTAYIAVKNEFGYQIKQIHIHEVNSSPENKGIKLKEEKEYPQNDEDIIKAENVMARHSQALMKMHKNITRISVSWVKSTKFGKADATMNNEVCVSLYVPKKGLIPIEEKPFPTIIDGFSVDVREGVCVPFCLGPHDFHENIKMGCAISGHRVADQSFTGTLGGFFEKEEKCYGLTCAHVFLQNPNLEGLERNGSWEATKPNDPSNFVYQPTPDTLPFGSLTQAVFNSGDGNTSGIDAAVFHFQQRYPSSGIFPDAINGRKAENPMLFNSGKLSKKVKRMAYVVKHGSSTGITKGRFRTVCPSVRLMMQKSWSFEFYRQYEIESIDDTKFATEGDSGAMVFTVEDEELIGIGIVEGGMGDVCFVTPIYDVLSALRIPPPFEMKRFVTV